MAHGWAQSSIPKTVSGRSGTWHEHSGSPAKTEDVDEDEDVDKD
jgi:hypothetical protein